jgi:hypothetical protein
MTTTRQEWALDGRRILLNASMPPQPATVSKCAERLHLSLDQISGWLAKRLSFLEAPSETANSFVAVSSHSRSESSTSPPIARGKPKRRTKRQPRNPFNYPGWQRFVMRSIEADQMASRAALVRRTTTGETLH